MRTVNATITSILAIGLLAGSSVGVAVRRDRSSLAAGPAAA